MVHVESAGRTGEGAAGTGPGPRVFDADGHVVEPPGMWRTHLPRRFWHYAPHIVQEPGHFRFVCDDRVSFPIPGRAETLATPGVTLHPDGTPRPAGGAADPHARLVDMDTDAISTAALYPTFGLMVQAVAEPEAASALLRAVNDWLAEYAAAAPDRLVAAGGLPMTGADEALAEARRCVEELGCRALWRRPEQLRGQPPLHDPAYEPLWGYLSDAGIALAIHPGVNGVIPVEHLRARFGTYFSAIHAVHFVAEQMSVLTDLVAYGILERHPGLKVAFLECGATWAVSYCHRLDEHLETFGFDLGALSMTPSEYFARQCVVAVEEPEPGLAAMVARFPRSVVFASDYPHGDATFPGSTTALLATPDLSGTARADVLSGNARRLYGLG